MALGLDEPQIANTRFQAASLEMRYGLLSLVESCLRLSEGIGENH
jgi:hypothetical protein